MSISFAAQEIFEQIELELGAGMVPRIFKLLEPQPALLGSFWGQFRETVLQGDLPRVLKEMVGLVVATATQCDYVRVVHLHSLTIQGVDKQALEAVSRGNYGVEEISTIARKVLQFVAFAVATRGTYGAADPNTWKDLRQQTAHALNAIGLEEQEELELVATVALFEQICTVANLLALDPNQP